MAKSKKKTHVLPCSCGGSLRSGTVPEFDATDAIGLPARLTGAVPGLKCSSCDLFMVSVSALHKANVEICRVLLTKERRLSGQELRFLRKNLAGLSQQELADRIGVDRRSLIRWEKQYSLNPDTDLLLRGAFVGELLRETATKEDAAWAREALKSARSKKALKHASTLRLRVSRGESKVA